LMISTKSIFHYFRKSRLEKIISPERKTHTFDDIKLPQDKYGHLKDILAMFYPNSVGQDGKIRPRINMDKRRKREIKKKYGWSERRWKRAVRQSRQMMKEYYSAEKERKAENREEVIKEIIAGRVKQSSEKDIGYGKV